MSERRRQREHHAYTWGAILLFLGVVFLLQNLDVLPWGLWGTLWRFWPVLIIILGINILFRHSNPWLVSILVLLLLFACLGIAIWQYSSSSPIKGTTGSYAAPLDSLEKAKIEIDFNGGSFIGSDLAPGSSNLVEIDSEMNGKNGGINANFQRQGNKGELYLSTKQVDHRFLGDGGIRWDAKFTTTIPLTIEVKSAASNLELILDKLMITELRMDVDAGNYKIKMPSSAGITRAYIKADVANIEVLIPEGVAAKLKIDTDLSASEVNESRFPKNGDYYASVDFESAENRVELELDCDVSRVQVK